jgi:hypothetical protein
MQKSMVSLIFIAILLGGVILSTALVAEPTELEIPNYYDIPNYGKVYGTSETIREKYDFIVTEKEIGEPPSAPALSSANCRQILLK